MSLQIIWETIKKNNKLIWENRKEGPNLDWYFGVWPYEKIIFKPSSENKWELDTQRVEGKSSHADEQPCGDRIIRILDLKRQRLNFGLKREID